MSGGGVSGHIGGLQGWGMDGRWWRVSVSTCVQLFSRGSERERQPSMMVSVDCEWAGVRLACCDLSSDDRGRISGEAAADSRGVNVQVMKKVSWPFYFVAAELTRRYAGQ